MALYNNQQAEDEADVARVQFADSPDVLEAMDSFYGTNLKSRVNIHNDEESDAKVKENGVDAIASGNDIYFGNDAYNMNDRNSRGLLAHEAAHVIQQGGLNGMNMNSPFGAEQGGVKDFFGAIGKGIVYGMSAVAGAGWGLLTNWGWPFKKARFGIKEPKEKENNLVVVQKDIVDSDVNRRLFHSPNPLNMNNGMIKLSDGYNAYGDNLLPDTTARGKMGSFERGTTAPDIAAAYDHRDEDDFENTARKTFNNAAEYVGNLKLRLLTSTITGSIIAALLNHNWQIIRRAWPIRLVLGAVRWGGTVLVGIGQAIRGLYGKFTRNERHKAEAAAWWEQNAGPFFIPYFGRKVHNFFTWIRSKLRGRGDVKKSGLMYDYVDDKQNDFENDIIKNKLIDNKNLNISEQFGSLINISGMDVSGGQGGITEDIQEAEAVKNGQANMSATESASEDEAIENMEAIQNITEDDLKDAPDELKAELVKNSKIDPLTELDDKAKGEMVGDILSDPNVEELIEPVLTSEDKEKIKNTDDTELAREAKAGNTEGEPEEEALSMTQGMPMMPFNGGESLAPGGAGPITYANAAEAIDDGWSTRVEGFEKLRDSFEEVRLYSENYGAEFYENLRELQMAAESRDNAKVRGLYQRCLEKMSELSDSSEDGRLAKIWGMRFLKSVNIFSEKQAA